MSYFEENKKLFSFKGVIGRRDFFALYIIVGIICCVLYYTPLYYHVLRNPILIKTLSSSSLPMWASVMVIVAGAITGLILFPAVVRRIRDIIGEENDGKIFLMATAYFATGIIALTPAGMKYGVGFFDIILDLCLIFMKGSITGDKPKNEIVKFNWGAFFGTWIWGLWNKCYITLLMLPLLLTTGGWFLFMILCGLKGNEWAYSKNKEKYESVEKFHSSQANQSILFLFVAPIVSILCAIGIIFASGTSLHKYIQKHPQFKTKMIDQLKQYQLQASEANFEKIEVTEDEYRFYLNPQGWNKMSNSAKGVFFEHALNYALIKNDRYIDSKDHQLDEYINIAKKVKILSTFNNEVLTEFSPTDEQTKRMKELSQNQEMKELWALRKKCIKFNTKPSMP